MRAVPTLAVLAGLLTGCAQPDCKPMISAELLFGLSRPGGAIDDAVFAKFLDESVTPRFPSGLTVLDGDGRWQSPDGRQTREKSKIVLIVTAPGADTMTRLQAVRSEYKARFAQQSVGLIVSRSCADF